VNIFAVIGEFVILYRHSGGSFILPSFRRSIYFIVIPAGHLFCRHSGEGICFAVIPAKHLFYRHSGEGRNPVII
jgi:hypothetical protein